MKPNSKSSKLIREKDLFLSAYEAIYRINIIEQHKYAMK